MSNCVSSDVRKSSAPVSQEVKSGGEVYKLLGKIADELIATRSSIATLTDAIDPILSRESDDEKLGSSDPASTPLGSELTKIYDEISRINEWVKSTRARVQLL